MAKEEEEKRGVAALPGGGWGVARLGTTGMFVFVVIFIIVVSVVAVGSVVVIGCVTSDVTPPLILSPLQVVRIGINYHHVLHNGRRWRVRPPPPPTLLPLPLPLW